MGASIDPQSSIAALGLSPDGSMLAVGSAVSIDPQMSREEMMQFRANIDLWQLSDGQIMRTLVLTDAYNLRHLLFSPDGQWLLAGPVDSGPFMEPGITPIWRVQDLQQAPRFQGFISAISPDSITMVVNTPPALELRSMRENSLLHTLTGADYEFDQPIFNHTGTLLAGSEVGTLSVWNVGDGSLLYRQATDHGIDQILFTPDDAVLLTVEYGPGATITLRQASDGKELYTLHMQAPNSGLKAIALSPNGRILAVAGGFAIDSATASATRATDHDIQLWDIQAGRLIDTYGGHRDDVLALAFSPDGQTLASASNDGDVYLWDVK